MDNCILKNIVILSRHGARTPTNSDTILHKKIYKNWKNHRGKLTKIGEQQSEILGENLAKKYLRYGFKPKIIYADSSNTQRTKQSLKYFVKGWKTIYQNRNKYYLINNKGKDPFLKLKYRISSLRDVKEDMKITHHFKDNDIDNMINIIQNKIKKKCNLDININYKNVPYVFTKIYNSIELNNASNNHKPIIDVNDNKKILKYFAKATFNNKYTRNKSLKVIGSTPKIIFNQLFKKNKNATFLFSHDNTIAAYLTYLGLYDWPITNFNGYISFELWENINNKNEYITISYNPEPFLKTNKKFYNNSKYFNLPPVRKHSYYYNISSLSQIPIKKKVFINRYNRYNR